MCVRSASQPAEFEKRSGPEIDAYDIRDESPACDDDIEINDLSACDDDLEISDQP